MLTPLPVSEWSNSTHFQFFYPDYPHYAWARQRSGPSLHVTRTLYKDSWNYMSELLIALSISWPVPYLAPPYFTSASFPCFWWCAIWSLTLSTPLQGILLWKRNLLLTPGSRVSERSVLNNAYHTHLHCYPHHHQNQVSWSFVGPRFFNIGIQNYQVKLKPYLH